MLKPALSDPASSFFQKYCNWILMRNHTCTSNTVFINIIWEPVVWFNLICLLSLISWKIEQTDLTIAHNHQLVWKWKALVHLEVACTLRLQSIKLFIMLNVQLFSNWSHCAKVLPFSVCSSGRRQPSGHFWEDPNALSLTLDIHFFFFKTCQSSRAVTVLEFWMTVNGHLNDCGHCNNR